jgi:cell division protein FtsL
MIVSDLNEEKFAYNMFVDELGETYKKRDRRHASVKRMLLIGLVATCLVILTLLYLGINAKVNKSAYALNNLQEELNTIKKENDMLNLKIAELKSLERIERVAINKLNMKRPDSTRVLSMADAPPQGVDVVPEEFFGEPERVELAHAHEVRKKVQASVLTAFSKLTVRWFYSSSAH